MPLDETPLQRHVGIRSGSPAAYLLATLIAAIAVVLRMALDSHIAGVQFIAFFPAVLIAAYIGGTEPGIVAAILCGIASWYLIIPPRSSWTIAEPAQLHALAVYFVVAPIGAVAVGAMHRAMIRQRLAEARQEVLIAELQHRTRNLLAVVRSIAEQTMRSTETFEAFAPRFNSRLAALGRVQSLVSRGDEWIDLDELVRSELGALNADPDGTRVRLSGPSLVLPPAAVQVLALALHELATNAVKHGALSRPQGRLSVRWDVFEARYKPVASISWIESGVPLAHAEPPGRGFGRQLIEKALPYDLGASTRLEFTPDGVHCRIELPLSAPTGWSPVRP